MIIKNLINKKLILIISFILFINLINAQFSGGDSYFTNYQVYGKSVNPQFSQPSFYSGGFNPLNYWQDFDKESCDERQDFLLMIPPGGCSPPVVRSDLLEERNVPVFCKVSSIRLNPLIDVSNIKNIRFTDKSKGDFEVSYFPANAYIRSGDVIQGSPVVNNIGYLVIVLNRIESEKDMPDFVSGNVTAVINYDMENSFGIGKQNFFSSGLDDEEWERKYKEFGFWQGKGFLRIESINEDYVDISIYRDANSKISSLRLKKGETSNPIYIGGFYCSAQLKVKLENLEYPSEKALIKFDNDEIWVKKGSRFFNDKCRVVDLDSYDSGGGNVRISCGTSFDLSLNPARVELSVDDNLDSYSLGDLITSKNKNVYLGYAGKSPRSENDFIVLIKTADSKESFDAKRIPEFLGRRTENSKDDTGLGETAKHLWSKKWWQALETISDLWTDEEKEFFTYLKDELNSVYNIPYEDIMTLNQGQEIDSLFGFGNIKFEKAYVQRDLGKAKEYYDNAINDFNDIFEFYANENLPNSDGVSFGEQALYEAGVLSGNLNLYSEEMGYFHKLIENYPDSSLSRDAENKLNYLSYRGAESQALVNINNEEHFISLLYFDKPGYNEAGAEIIIKDNGKIETYKLGLDELIETKESKLPLKIKDINENSVKIEYYPNKALRIITQGIIGDNKIIERGIEEQLTGDVSIRVNKINIKKEANVNLIPEIKGTKSYSNLSFSIGIEKRAIELSPEKTQEMINNLNEQIKKWSEINNKLTEVVKGMKGACFATSALLTVKNWFSGMSGESMARHEIMTSKGGWNEKCRLAVSGNSINGKVYSSVEECLLDNNDNIENDVREYTNAIEETNNKLKEVQNKVGSSGGFLEESYNINEVEKTYCEDYFKEFYSNNQNLIIDLGSEGETLLNQIISQYQVDNCQVDLDTMKTLMTMSEFNQGVLSEISKNRFSSELISVYERNQYNKERDAVKQVFGEEIPVFNYEGEIKYQEMKDVDSQLKNNYSNLNDCDKVFGDYLDGEEILVCLRKTGEGYSIKKLLNKKGEEINEVSYYKGYRGVDLFKEANLGLYQNRIRDARVEYFQNAPYQGMPALVPFDEQNGWYVATDYIVSGFGQPFESSGRAVNFWVCNVGENGLIEFKQGDDCRYYNLGSSADLDFPGLTKTQSSGLVRDAERALREASNKYKDRMKSVMINGKNYPVNIADNRESGKCSDFMSPADCHLMFNVCDPVICPASRCDYGGQYRVANVVQSGIIGSLLLCLPNYQEGIAIPICLTGVNAGIESYLSILNSTQECLKESLETGRNIGICDEIKSIYLCEFFWKQAVPLMDVFIPRMFEALIGQGARGGGEYLTVQYAYDNMMNSVDYFKNEYAVNAIKAFNMRSTAEIGGEVCKMFIGINYPDTSDMFDELLEPESPPQYMAWFSENILNDATVPPTSHYKVYYHIYAGKDYGVNYVVYLKNTKNPGLINIGSYVVDRGYIRTGSQVDEAADFTSVSGYQELCINVNGQEECGFGQVSTSFALDYLSDKYVSEQANQTNIKTSEECIAGEPSFYSLANPNLQEGVEDVINPGLYKKGVIRVCSTNNPGKQVNDIETEYDRWKKVGYCDDPSIGCWIDTSSIKNVLSDNKGLLNETLENINSEYLKDIIEETGMWDSNKANSIFESAEKLKEGIKKSENPIKELDNNIEILNSLENASIYSPFNYQKANALYLRGLIYGEVAKKVYNLEMERIYQQSLESEEKNSKISQENGLDSYKEIEKDIEALEISENKRLGELNAKRDLNSDEEEELEILKKNKEFRERVSFYYNPGGGVGFLVDGDQTDFYLIKPNSIGNLHLNVNSWLTDEVVGYYNNGIYHSYDRVDMADYNKGEELKELLKGKKIYFENNNFVIKGENNNELLNWLILSEPSKWTEEDYKELEEQLKALESTEDVPLSGCSDFGFYEWKNHDKTIYLECYLSGGGLSEEESNELIEDWDLNQKEIQDINDYKIPIKLYTKIYLHNVYLNEKTNEIRGDIKLEKSSFFNWGDDDLGSFSIDNVKINSIEKYSISDLTSNSNELNEQDKKFISDFLNNLKYNDIVAKLNKIDKTAEWFNESEQEQEGETRNYEELKEQEEQEEVEIYSNLRGDCWTLENAYKYIENRLNKRVWNENTNAYITIGEYSDVPENDPQYKEISKNPNNPDLVTSIFIEDLYNCNVLTQGEYEDIKGGKWYNWKEDVGFVEGLLKNKIETPFYSFYNLNGREYALKIFNGEELVKTTVYLEPDKREVTEKQQNRGKIYFELYGRSKLELGEFLQKTGQVVLNSNLGQDERGWKHPDFKGNGELVYNFLNSVEIFYNRESDSISIQKK